MTAPSLARELEAGPTTSGMPWRKIAITLVVILVVGAFLWVGTAKAIKDEREGRFGTYRSRCAALPAEVEAAVAAGLTDLEDRVVRGVGTSQAVEGELTGSWFVSLELAAPTLARGSIGDVVTFLVPDGGGAPAATDIRAVGADAHRWSTWPVAEGVLIDADGGVASRWCAADDGPGVLHS